MRRILNLLILILVPLAISFFIYALDKPENKRGYLIGKYVDTVEVAGKNVPNDIYGLTFNLVYQEKYTMEIERKRVDRKQFDTAEVNANDLIVYTTK